MRIIIKNIIKKMQKIINAQNRSLNLFDFTEFFDFVEIVNKSFNNIK